MLYATLIGLNSVLWEEKSLKRPRNPSLDSNLQERVRMNVVEGWMYWVGVFGTHFAMISVKSSFSDQKQNLFSKSFPLLQRAKDLHAES